MAPEMNTKVILKASLLGQNSGNNVSGEGLREGGRESCRSPGDLVQADARK
jgi:hypothetical protein